MGNILKKQQKISKACHLSISFALALRSPKADTPCLSSWKTLTSFIIHDDCPSPYVTAINDTGDLLCYLGLLLITKYTFSNIESILDGAEVKVYMSLHVKI